ncbi:hypothetical protein ZIOFF_022077 [Zingiber officinale]|uniref:Uncharacterized protein n=1 Tax=Zingiber officinale TaxID=94328 RepID=A0A8J5LGZ1_ZINOF|nr:hypothetical protein ZIOFF_022077 [Zingiber officinale]
MQERASIVPAEVLYHSRRDDAHHRVYVHRSEEAMLVTDNHQVDRSFIQEESFNQLRRSRMQYIHLGVLQVRVQILHRQREGTMTLIVFKDNRWQGDQAILATMEVDLTSRSQMIYVIPEIMMTIGDFYRNIQISILTRGYEAWQNSEANLLITRGLVGRLSNTPNIGFAYEIQGVVDYLTSHGVNALSGRSFSTRSLQGLNCVINPTQISIPVQPSEVNSQTMMDGRISLSFSNYAAAQPSEQPVYNNKDEEVQEILAVLIEVKPGVFTNFEGTADEYYEEYGDIDDYIEKGKQIIDQDERYSSTPEPHILVNKISQHATLPQKQTEGSTGLDIFASHAATIWAGFIGAGVIDSDYRGEVEVLPEVYEVPHLSYSERGDKGFGSTDKPNTIPEPAQDKASTSQQPRHFTANDIFSLLMPRETAAVLDTDDSYLDYIAYLASLSTSNKLIWDDYPESDTEWINLFASKGGGESELIAANCEMEYPSLRRLLQPSNQSMSNNL